MIKAYLTFCSVVYHFYIRKKEEDIPVFYTFLFSSVILTLNVFSIYELAVFFIGHNLPFTNLFTYGTFALVSLINAVFIYSNPSNFKELIPTTKNNNSAVIYIIISLVLIVLSSVYYQNNR